MNFLADGLQEGRTARQLYKARKKRASVASHTCHRVYAPNTRALNSNVVVSRGNYCVANAHDTTIRPSEAGNSQESSINPSSSANRNERSDPTNDSDNDWVDFGTPSHHDNGRENSSHFHQVFARMKNEGKWRLESTGAYVEDRLYRAFEAKSDEWLDQSLIGSWTVDLQAADVLAVFSRTEQTEILQRTIVPVPRLPDEWADAFTRFEGSTNDTELIEQMTRHLAAPTSIESREKIWLHTALGHWTILCGTAQFNESRADQWWTMHLWAPMFDTLLQLIPGVVMERSEISPTSLSSYVLTVQSGRTLRSEAVQSASILIET